MSNVFLHYAFRLSLHILMGNVFLIVGLSVGNLALYLNCKRLLWGKQGSWMGDIFSVISYGRPLVGQHSPHDEL